MVQLRNLTGKSNKKQFYLFINYIKNNRKMLVLYHAKWCGHCVTFLPVFNKFKRILKKKYNNDLIIYTIEHEAITILKNDYNFSEVEMGGFPTLIYYENKNKQKYEDSRDLQGLLNWSKENLGLQEHVVKKNKSKRVGRKTLRKRRRKTLRKRLY
jgi:thiol-disulfide isomerase/thioredoxin